MSSHQKHDKDTPTNAKLMREGNKPWQAKINYKGSRRPLLMKELQKIIAIFLFSVQSKLIFLCFMKKIPLGQLKRQIPYTIEVPLTASDKKTPKTTNVPLTTSDKNPYSY